MEANRVYNFNPGPSTLPLSVLKEAQEEFLNFSGSGMSVLEISHRAEEYAAVHQKAKADVLELTGLGDDYAVLFLQGGASLQFAMLPMNFATKEHKGAYVLSGVFASRAYEEANLLGVGAIAASGREGGFRRIPQQSELRIDPTSAYVHICNNNTIYGTEFHYIPETGGVPLFADMSSDIFSRATDFSRFDLIYAGIQKNLGPAGAVLVIAKKSLLEKNADHLPTMLRYSTFAESDSLYNTPPVFCIYMVGKALARIKAEGGLAALEERNRRKARIVYDAIDASNGYYRGHAEKDSRSFMNVTFRLPSGELEKTFAEKAREQSLAGLKGHRSVGGMRASIYNAMPVEGCEKLAAFMDDFRRNHPCA